MQEEIKIKEQDQQQSSTSFDINYFMSLTEDDNMKNDIPMQYEDDLVHKSGKKKRKPQQFFKEIFLGNTFQTDDEYSMSREQPNIKNDYFGAWESATPHIQKLTLKAKIRSPLKNTSQTKAKVHIPSRCQMLKNQNSVEAISAKHYSIFTKDVQKRPPSILQVDQYSEQMRHIKSSMSNSSGQRVSNVRNKIQESIKEERKNLELIENINRKIMQIRSSKEFDNAEKNKNIEYFTKKSNHLNQDLIIKDVCQYQQQLGGQVMDRPKTTQQILRIKSPPIVLLSPKYNQVSEQITKRIVLSKKQPYQFKEPFQEFSQSTVTQSTQKNEHSADLKNVLEAQPPLPHKPFKFGLSNTGNSSQRISALWVNIKPPSVKISRNQFIRLIDFNKTSSPCQTPNQLQPIREMVSSGKLNRDACPIKISVFENDQLRSLDQVSTSPTKTSIITAASANLPPRKLQRTFQAYQTHTSMFKKHHMASFQDFSQFPLSIKNSHQPIQSKIDEDDKINEEQLNKIKETFSSQKILFKPPFMKQDGQTRNLLRSKLNHAKTSNLLQYINSSKPQVSLSQSKLNVLQHLNPIIEKLDNINHYEVNKSNQLQSTINTPVELVPLFDMDKNQCLTFQMNNNNNREGVEQKRNQTRNDNAIVMENVRRRIIIR